MRLPFVLAVAAGLLATRQGPGCDPAKSDRDRLQGTWRLVSVEAGIPQLSELSMEDLANARLVVQGKRCSLTFGGTHWRAAYTLHAGKRPRAIDLAITSGPDKGQVVRAVYALEQDRLRLCYHPKPGGKRPAALRAEAGAEIVLITWERQAS
jgi:uncharacterized protein (TIGR03067 family)